MISCKKFYFENAQRIARKQFGNITNFFEILRGVMNYKYQFTFSNQNYIIRCYPNGREFLAETEYKYLQLFKKNRVKSPLAIYFSNKPFAYLIYEKLEGECLSDLFDEFPLSIQKNLCLQILDNYKTISEQKVSGNGCILGFDKFEYKSWYKFLSLEIKKSFEYLSDANKPYNIHILKRYMLDTIDTQINERRNMVWSDFNPENIIVSTKGELIGFIDFEGIIGGDPLLGIGYLQARNADSLFYKILYECGNFSIYKDTIDFYSILRYIRLIPYEMSNLPNESKRTPVEFFLPNSIKLINQKIYEKQK